VSQFLKFVLHYYPERIFVTEPSCFFINDILFWEFKEQQQHRSNYKTMTTTATTKKHKINSSNSSSLALSLTETATMMLLTIATWIQLSTVSYSNRSN
jgi:hypothetical protein